MKKCQRCGNMCEDQVVYCGKCGAPMQVKPVPAEPPKHPAPPSDKGNTPKKPKKKRKKGAIIATAAAAAVVVCAGAAGVLYLRWYLSPEQELFRALDAGKWEEAVSLVEEDHSLRRSDEFEEALRERITTVQSEYTAGTVEYSQAILELDTIARMEVEEVKEAIDEVKSVIERINTSRTCFSTGEAFFEKGHYVEAMEQYAQVITEDSNYEAAQTRYADCVNQYRQTVLADAEKYAQSESYSSAIELLKTGLTHLSGDKALTEQIALYEKANNEKMKTTALENAKKYADSGDYVAAMQVLAEYRADNGEDVDVNLAAEQYRTTYVTAVLEEASQIAASGDYIGAIDVIEKGQEKAGEDAQLIGRIEHYEAEYAKGILSKSDAFLASADYAKAEETVNAGLKIFPENADLLTQLEKIDAARPKYLLDVCQPYEASKFNSRMDGKNFKMGGKEYGNGFNLYIDYYVGGYAYFNLDGRYTKLSFICGHWDGAKMYNAKVEVYCDGVLAQQATVSAGSLPTTYEVDVTGVKQLRIRLSTDEATIVGFAEVTVQ